MWAHRSGVRHFAFVDHCHVCLLAVTFHWIKTFKCSVLFGCAHYKSALLHPEILQKINCFRSFLVNSEGGHTNINLLQKGRFIYPSICMRAKHRNTYLPLKVSATCKTIE